MPGSRERNADHVYISLGPARPGEMITLLNTDIYIYIHIYITMKAFAVAVSCVAIFEGASAQGGAWAQCGGCLSTILPSDP